MSNPGAIASTLVGGCGYEYHFLKSCLTPTHNNWRASKLKPLSVHDNRDLRCMSV